jgi:hypothetical protein
MNFINNLRLVIVLSGFLNSLSSLFLFQHYSQLRPLSQYFVPLVVCVFDNFHKTSCVKLEYFNIAFWQKEKLYLRKARIGKSAIVDVKTWFDY